MRTKILLLGAAIFAAGIATLMADSSNVYSQNVVGYINLTLNEGFNLVAGQLDADQTGTNNTVETVFGTPSTLPLASQVFVFNGTTFDTETWNKNKSGTATNWSSSTGSPLVLNPGQGCWVSIPSGAFSGGTGTVTIVGNVLQGTLINSQIPPVGGFALVSSQVPLSGGIGSTLAYTPYLNDQVYIWNGSTYDSYTYAKNKAGTATNWNSTFGFGVEPSLNIGQGFWLYSATGSGWTNNFTVK